MPSARRKFGGGAGLAVLAVLATGPAVACSCAQPTPQQAFERATAVFVGRVVGIDQPLLTWLGIARGRDMDVTFAVARRWKAADEALVTVQTRLSGEACGFTFEMGGDYLVFVAPSSTEFPVTGICNGTRALAGAEADLRALNALVEEPDASVEDESESGVR